MANNLQQAIPYAVKIIKNFEGFVASSYRDIGGAKTIGYGFLVTEVDQFPQTMTEEEATTILQTKIQAIGNSLIRIHPFLHPKQLAALISFCYNCGISNYRTSTLCQKIKKLEKGYKTEQDKTNILQDIKKQFLRWKHVKGRVVQGLLNRRQKEYALFASGTI